jgi:hypothetical protein
MRSGPVQLAVDFLRKLFATHSASINAVRVDTTSAQERESFEGPMNELIRRAPDDLQAVFRDTIHYTQRSPASGTELLDAIDAARTGLGVAIGRGATGEEQKYEQLGRLCSWLFEELGRPESAQYAVVLRASIQLEVKDSNRNET